MIKVEEREGRGVRKVGRKEGRKVGRKGGRKDRITLDVLKRSNEP